MGRRDVVPFDPAIVEPPLKLTPGPPIALAAIHVGRLARPRSNERTAAAATRGVAGVGSGALVGVADVPVAARVKGPQIA